jgi:hypothetical protein
LETRLNGRIDNVALEHTSIHELIAQRVAV